MTQTGSLDSHFIQTRKEIISGNHYPELFVGIEVRRGKGLWTCGGCLSSDQHGLND